MSTIPKPHNQSIIVYVIVMKVFFFGIYLSDELIACYRYLLNCEIIINLKLEMELNEN